MSYTTEQTIGEALQWIGFIAAVTSWLTICAVLGDALRHKGGVVLGGATLALVSGLSLGVGGTELMEGDWLPAAFVGASVVVALIGFVLVDICRLLDKLTAWRRAMLLRQIAARAEARRKAEALGEYADDGDPRPYG